MNTSPTKPRYRYLAIAIIVAGVAIQLFRILQVQSPTGETPFFSANDRSRWCTIAALAIDGTYQIDKVLELRDPKTKRRTWYTIDLVRHRGQDGELHYYSSKPPLLPTLYTGVYLIVRSATGATLMKHTFFVAKITLIIVNLVPLALLWFIMARKATRDHNSDLWSVVILTLFISFGTFLSTFCNTLNNHLPGAIAAGVSLWCLDRILLAERRRWYWFALCGLATSFTAANELPALSWVVIVGGLLLLIDLRRTLLAYLPALLPVAVAFFVTNYIAHGVWRPAYAHRDLGDRVVGLKIEPGTPIDELKIEDLIAIAGPHRITISPQAIIRPARRDNVYELWDESQHLRLGLKLDQPDTVGIYNWDDWYDYPNSYWIGDRKKGVDRGEPNPLVYAFHCLIGHHGIFSLTPFWLLAVVGAFTALQRRDRSQWLDPHFGLAAAIVITTIVCVGFYLARPLEDRNYGGVSSGLRWVFWMTPLWFWLACDALKYTKRFTSRRLVEIALIVSIVSANYPWSNPWVAPWIMQWWQSQGWISY